MQETIKNRKIKTPPAFIYNLLSKIVGGIRKRKFGVEYYYHFDIEEMKGKQVVMIADHATWDSYIYVVSGYPFVRLNTVVGYHHVFKRFLYGLLTKVFQVIPKKNYQNDMLSMKQMLGVVKNGGSLLVFPEGTQSKSGSNVALTPSTAGFLKKLGKPVVLCKSFGSYLAHPLWKDNIAKGRQEFHYEVLFTPEQLKALDKDAIYDKMLERFRYNDFEWNKEKRYKYETDAEGMEKIVFTCPNCGEKFTLKTSKDSISCTACGASYKVNEFVEFEGAPYRNIDEWLKDERRMIREEIKDPDFKIVYDAELYALKEQLSSEPYQKTGEARITIDARGISFDSLDRQKADARLLELEHIPSILATPGKFNLVYYKNELIKIVPKGNKNICIRNMIAVEELHALGDPIWAKVMEDAYR